MADSVATGGAPAMAGHADKELIAEIVRSVLGTMHGDLTVTELGLLSEIEELGRMISSTKAEIASLRFGEITHTHIPLATDELDAVVMHTAAATDCILEVCETLDEVAASLTAAGNCVDAPAQLQEATTRIYEACSFQDITGQRIAKVVAALKLIEGKVAQIISTFGASRPQPVRNAADQETASEAALLNGPQLPAAAMAQTEIDRLLASFD